MAAMQKPDRPSQGGASSAPVPQVVAPPAPPGESPPEAVHKTQAVATVLAELGEQASPKEVAEAVKRKHGMALELAEVTEIMRVLKDRTHSPPPLDQPPPEGARRPPGGATSASALR
jgi:hypothetical protein